MIRKVDLRHVIYVTKDTEISGWIDPPPFKLKELKDAVTERNGIRWQWGLESWNLWRELLWNPASSLSWSFVSLKMLIFFFSKNSLQSAVAPGAGISHKWCLCWNEYNPNFSRDSQLCLVSYFHCLKSCILNSCEHHRFSWISQFCKILDFFTMLNLYDFISQAIAI